MADSTQIIEQAEALLRRVSPEGRRQAKRARERRRKAAMKVFTRMVYVLIAVMIAVGVIGSILPAGIGVNGVMIAMVALLLGWMGVIRFSKTPEYTPEVLVQTDIKALPQRTEAWLQQQRPALPAPAQRIVDGIGLKLEAMAPQLQGLELDPPAAAALRKLMGEELPELIGGYQRVPAGLRRETRGGYSPDRQLLDGLATVDEELARMSEQLASGDLHKLAVQQRYLELKYKGDDEVAG